MKSPFLFPVLMGINLWVFAIAQVDGSPPAPQPTPTPQNSSYVVFGYNDLGMHCANKDFSELCILPPANTFRATVIRRGSEPQIVTQGVSVLYSIPGNTESATKTNFWQYAKPLFGVDLPPNVGLFGFGLAGQMQATTARDWSAPGIPVTQITDSGLNDSYQLAKVDVVRNGAVVATTQNVIPVSWEISCNLCHVPSTGESMETKVLKLHDQKHGTNLINQRPVLCASCHADPALGTSGAPNVKSMSQAMHGSHANYVSRSASRLNQCYTCHPGPQTQCLRDVHKTKGMTCTNCHGSMQAVANPNRRPWQDEPRCGDCHHVQGHEYEQPGVLYRDSVGHNGVKCIVCHNSPHAISPSENPRDNVQATNLQGHAGTIDTCTVCHTNKPSDPFNHTRHD